MSTDAPKEQRKPANAGDEADLGKPDRRSKRGGYRPGAGRPAYLKPGKRKAESAYISMTPAEKESLEKLAAIRGMSLSYYLRERLGLPVEVDDDR